MSVQSSGGGSPTKSAVRSEMSRALAVLFGFGGTLGLVSLAFQHWNDLHAPGVAAPAVVAAIASVGLLLAGARMPAWAFHAAVLLGTACITVAVYYGGGSARAIYSPFYVWVALYAFYFFSAAAAAWHLAIASASFLTVLLLSESVAPGPVWVINTGTAVATGIVVKALVSRVLRLASTDPLTGLLNRRAWDDLLPGEVARSHRRHAPLSVAMLDLDGLKVVNDTQGHAAGDEAIVAAATVWRRLARRGDLVARLGGDEFGLLLADCNAEQALRTAARYRTALAGMSVSVGVASLREGEAGPSLLNRADRALYEAKRSGGDQVTAIE